MYIRAVFLWFVLLASAVLNGALRVSLLIPRFGESPGHVLSTLLLCLVILLITLASIRWLRPATARTAWGVGLMWVAMTLAFEFLAGHYLFGHPWERLLADYDVSRGRIWILVLIITGCAPAFAHRRMVERP